MVFRLDGHGSAGRSNVCFGEVMGELRDYSRPCSEYKKMVGLSDEVWAKIISKAWKANRRPGQERKNMSQGGSPESTTNRDAGISNKTPSPLQP